LLNSNNLQFLRKSLLLNRSRDLQGSLDRKLPDARPLVRKRGLVLQLVLFSNPRIQELFNLQSKLSFQTSLQLKDLVDPTKRG
jgi:hypothetical protein